MAAETGFMIDCVLHEVPELDSLNMDEAQVLYDYSGLTLEDFVQPEGVDDDEHEENLRPKLRNPGFMRALMHIAYQRSNPRTPAAKVKTVIAQAKIISALEHLAGEEDEQELPPDMTTEPDASSAQSSVDSSANSGSDSTDSSAAQVVQLASTTTAGSDTSSTSDQASSAA